MGVVLHEALGATKSPAPDIARGKILFVRVGCRHL